MNLSSYLTELLNEMKTLIFPEEQFCPICLRNHSKNGNLCSECLKRISFIIPPFCRICGRTIRLKDTTEACVQCRQHRLLFTKARAVALYDGLLRECLKELKYRYRPELGFALGNLLTEWFKLNATKEGFRDCDVLVTVPLHRQKMLQRGYNQAKLLAEPLATYLGKPLYDDEVLSRIKETDRQSSLDAHERHKNLKGVFEVVVPNLIADKKILLIDDILTTGATASEAARALLRAGAIEVKLLTLASGTRLE